MTKIQSHFTRSALLATMVMLPYALAHAVEGEEEGAGAPASVTLGVVGGLTGVDTTSDDSVQSTTEDKKWGWGGSVFFDTPLSPMFSLGIGALYLNRTFEVGSSALRIERNVPTIYVPLEARIWLGNILYLGGGAFGAFRVGDVQNKVISGSTTLVTWDEDDRDSFEYGLNASVGLTFPVAERTGLTVEGRYLHGLNDPYGGPYEEEIRDLAFTAGVRLSL